MLNLLDIGQIKECGLKKKKDKINVIVSMDCS